jgi:hypothetical protein
MILVTILSVSFKFQLQKKTKKKNIKTSRNIDPDSINRFKLALSRVTWNDVYQSNDVNESFNLFWSTFSDLFELHFPYVSRKPNKNLHKINEYMTAGLLVSRSTKNKLFVNMTNRPTDHNTRKYKTYRNIYNSLVRKSRKLMYAEKLFM